MNTTVSVGDGPRLSITHADRHELTSHERRGLVVESPEENDVLTEIRVGVDPDSFSVRVSWRRIAGGDFHVLYVPERETLFLGAGRVSAVVACAPRAIVAVEHPLLFWHYERMGRYVVSFGEIECLLHALDGRVLQRATVDPPYEVARRPWGLEFESIVAGTAALRFED